MGRVLIFMLLIIIIKMADLAIMKHAGGMFSEKITSYFCRSFLVFALPIFTVRAIYRPAVRKCPVDTCRQKKAPTFQSRLGVCVTYFHG